MRWEEFEGVKGISSDIKRKGEKHRSKLDKVLIGCLCLSRRVSFIFERLRVYQEVRPEGRQVGLKRDG